MPSLNSISFVWPPMLWLFLLLPLLIGTYVLILMGNQRRQSLSLKIPSQLTTMTAWRKHLPAFLLLLGLAAMIASLARPRAMLLLPTRMDSVMLAVDISGSMAATDIAPNRIAAAQSAIKKFIDAQPSQVKLGVVTIASTAALAQAPTINRDDLYRIIENFPLQAGSALGSGILIALTELIPGTGIDVQKILTDADRPSPPTDTGRPLDMIRRPDAATRLEPGANKAAAIVLMSDGQSNFGPDPLKMAQIAADHGVRIYTVGIGTPEGAVLKAQGMSMRVKLDEPTLKKIAETTLGHYYRATSDTDLKQIYQSLSTTIRLEKHQTTEVSALFLALGIVLIFFAGVLSIRRNGRIL